MKILLTFTTLLPLLCMSVTVDETLNPAAWGVDVVDGVIQKIRTSALFLDDHNLLRRLANFQTQFGEIPADGGIWNVSQIIFEATQAGLALPNNDVILTRLNAEFSVSWTTLAYTESRKPIISGLTVSIFIFLNRAIAGVPPVNQPLQGLMDQAGFLGDHGFFTTDREGPFMVASWALESKFVCKNPLDLTVIIGGSQSRGSSFPATTRTEAVFASELFKKFTRNTARLGVIALNQLNEVNTLISLDDPYNDAEIQDAVLAAQGSSAQSPTTFINSELRAAVQMIQNSSVRRQGVPKILVTFANEKSSEGGVSNMAFVRQAGIDSFGISIGMATETVHSQQLLQLAQGDPSNMFQTFDPVADGQIFFRGLAWLHHRLAPQICDIHQSISVDSNNETVNEYSLDLGETVFFVADSLQGVTSYLVTVAMAAGTPAESFVGSISVSQNVRHPSTALYDFDASVGDNLVTVAGEGGKIFIRAINLNSTTPILFTIKVGSVTTIDVPSSTEDASTEDVPKVTDTTTPSACSLIGLTPFLGFLALIVHVSKKI